MSPYQNHPIEQWANITTQLVKAHPITTEQIRNAVFIAWEQLWNTAIGGQNGFILSEIEPSPPATVIGYFLEMLVAKQISLIHPNFIWGRGSEKDIHCVENGKFSIEMKTSGQLGYKVFGNRSYGQTGNNSKKDKSGYYITVNFYGKAITLIRFGWIDNTDWTSQSASTGQASTLSSNVYSHKLISITGDYMLNAPISITSGIGGKKEHKLNTLGLFTIRDILLNKAILTKNSEEKIYNAIYLQYGALLNS